MIQGITTTLFVADIDRAIRFYQGVLGLKLLGRWNNEFAMLGFDRTATLSLHPRIAGQGAHEAARHSIQIGFAVPAPLENAVARLVADGVHFTDEIREDGQVRLARFTDPDGHPLYLTEIKPRP